MKSAGIYPGGESAAQKLDKCVKRQRTYSARLVGGGPGVDDGHCAVAVGG